MFYVLIAGSRDFNNYQLLCSKADYMLQNKVKDGICIVSGGARGADSLAERYARERGYQLKVFPAQWNTYGRSAGYRRNEQMHQFLLQQKEAGVLCFWDGQSRGTKHNFDLCRKNGLSLKVFNYTLNRWVKMVTQ